MPYLHWETFSAYQKRLRSIDAALENIDFGRRRPLPEDLLSPYTTAKWKRQTALFKMKKFQTADKVIADKGKAKVTKRQRTHITKEEIEDRLVTRYYDYYGEDRVNSLNVGHNHPLLLHPLHVRRTLDRSYYYALEEAEIRKRDVDQVLYRYTYGELELYDPMMIMVDQLWLWVIDEQTAVSAFPRRWGLESKDGREKTDVQERVIQAISNEHKGIKTAEHLASIIVDKCSGVFFPEAEEEHDSVDFLDVFAVSIARLAYSQTKAFNDFCDDSRRPSKGVKKYDLQNNPLDSELRQREEHRKTCKDCGKKGVPEYWHRSQDHLHDRKCLALPDQPDYQTHATAMNSEGGRHAPRKQKSLVDISQETEYVKEIKDILDEMNSMARVFEQQIELLKSQRTTDNDDLYDADAAYTLHDVYGKVKERLARITQLQREAERVYSALRDLLDLKQKQASVKQTDDTAQQGLTILVFTIITIIFSPLSFIAAIFSMNAREINNTELRPLSKIWRIMFPVTVGVLALSLLLAFSVNPFAKGFEKLVDQWRVLQGTWHQRLRKYKFHPKNWFSSSGRGGNDRKGSDKEPLQVEEKEAEAEEHSAKKERTVILPLPKQSRMKLEKEKDTGGKKAEPETNIEESGMSGALQPEDTQKRFSLFRRQKKTDSKV
ncbi:hypothetical protein P154DRAFT_99544 [Amniculicola lignicola CBS 123094]|uniref:Cora-domain-containing protein n=1 Tax=Amniculicola lignicola CBS 123094 TaxID=1392246 RepID=A0A6A5WQK7_9PLEO|nr:hypothetical protein P154DRAFT_99544 [Amniculicola lignicola CBS 123094]